MLLVYPPSARSVEPPLGIARIAGFLRSLGRDARCLDLNAEAVDYLLGLEPAGGGRRGGEAMRRRGRNLELLRGPGAFTSRERHGRAVRELERAMRELSAPFGAGAGLADYREAGRSPLRRSDLLDAAARFQENIFHPLFSRRLDQALDESGAGSVGISICFLSQALCAFAVAGYLRASRPGLGIALGGGLVTSWASLGLLGGDETFGGLADAVVVGRGEEGILAALARIEGTDPAPGISARKAWAVPDFSSFDGSRYLAPLPVIPYNFSNGCPWRRCSFCPEKAEARPYAGIRADAATAELEALVVERRAGLLHFTDSEVSPLYLRTLVERPPGPRWYGFARFSELLADPGFCRRLAASGCAMLQLGLESADQSVLDALGKGTRLETIERSLASLAEAGVASYVYLLFGTPAEDRDAALRTRDFIASRAALVGYLNVAIFNLPALSAEAAGLRTRSFYEGDLSLYRDFSHPAGWDRPVVRAFLEREFSREPAIAEILARTPAVFTSSHAPLLPSPLGEGRSPRR